MKQKFPSSRVWLVRRAVRFAETAADALAQPSRGWRTAIILTLLYVLTWSAYALVAKGTQYLHHDMTEMFTWSQDPSLGYLKHPPFGAWIVAVWFKVFPRADWAYYLLSMTAVGVAMLALYAIAGDFLTGRKRAVAFVLLTVTPGFNFLALKFNPNSLLVPVWAVATWLLLRSWRERTALSGALAGLGVAVAMLSKYWSVFLILGFGVAAIVDPRRRAYFSSPAPYAAIIAGTLAIAPNVFALVRSDFAPIRYATAAHAAPSLMDVLASIGNYLGGLLYLIGPVVMLAAIVHPNRSAWRDMLWPADTERRFIAVMQGTSFVAPILVALTDRVGLDSLWTVSSWALLPSLLLSSSKITITRNAATSIIGIACLAPCIALVVSPLAAFNALRPGGSAELYTGMLASEVDRQWSEVSDVPLRYVAGQSSLAWGCTFYCRDEPRAFPWFNQSEAAAIDPDELRRHGFVALCTKQRSDCVAAAHRFTNSSPSVIDRPVTLTRSLFGFTISSRDYVIVLAPGDLDEPRPAAVAR